MLQMYSFGLLLACYAGDTDLFIADICQVLFWPKAGLIKVWYAREMGVTIKY